MVKFKESVNPKMKKAPNDGASSGAVVVLLTGGKDHSAQHH